MIGLDSPKQSSSRDLEGATGTRARRSFVVLATQRTGSGWVMDRVNNIRGAQGHMELFYPDIRRKPPRAGCNDYGRFVETGRQFASGRRPRAVFAYLDGLYARPGTVGFKLMYSQLRQYPEILLYLLRHRLSVVHLVRENHLDVLISEELARVTGTAHATVEEGVQDASVVELDPDIVAERVQRLGMKQQFFRRLLRVLPVPVHEISYEALLASDAAFVGLCRFLDLEADCEDRAGSRLVKRQRAPHCEVISNYRQVADALARAGHQQFLH